MHPERLGQDIIIVSRLVLSWFYILKTLEAKENVLNKNFTLTETVFVNKLLSLYIFSFFSFIPA